MSYRIIVPAGSGFEVDYDSYGPEYYENADKWWENYCQLGSDELEASGIKADLLEVLNNDVLLAMAVNHFIGEDYKVWLDRTDIDVLGGYTPRECLDTDHGIKRLRMLFLMAH